MQLYGARHRAVAVLPRRLSGLAAALHLTLTAPSAVARRVSAYPDVSSLVLIVALGEVARIAFFLLAPVFVHGDSFQYYRPAHFLMDGSGFPLPLKRPPAYPVFIAVIGNWLGEDLRYIVAV